LTARWLVVELDQQVWLRGAETEKDASNRTAYATMQRYEKYKMYKEDGREGIAAEGISSSRWISELCRISLVEGVGTVLYILYVWEMYAVWQRDNQPESESTVQSTS
jgi:hypothetical protein